MSRLRLVLLGLVLIIFAACGKKETVEQQPSPETPAVEPAPAPAPAPESSEAVPPEAVEKPADATQAARRTEAARPAPARRTQDRTASDIRDSRSERIPERTIAPPAAQESAIASRREETAARPPAPPEPRFVSIPSGTSIPVRLQDALDSGVNQAGDTFRAILDQNIEVNGQVAVPRGSILHGKLSNVARSGRVEGRAAMSLQLTSMEVGGRTYDIRSEILSFEAESSKKQDAAKVGVGAGLGAVIGAIAGGGKGAAIGAAVGAGAGGATVVATRGKELQFPVEHKMDFSLSQPVSVRMR